MLSKYAILALQRKTTEKQFKKTHLQLKILFLWEAKFPKLPGITIRNKSAKYFLSFKI